MLARDENIQAAIDFVEQQTKQVMLIVGTPDFTFLQTMMQQITLKRMIPIHIDIHKRSDAATSLNKASAQQRSVFIFTNSTLENHYVKYGLDKLDAKAIIICDPSLLHSLLDPSVYFAPIKGEKIQKHLFTKLTLRLSKNHKVNPMTASKSETLKTATVKTLTSENTLQHHYLNQRLWQKDTILIQRLADRVLYDESYKAYMFELVYASRDDLQIQIVAANAITILNCANISFARLDLSGIHIPGADLSNAICDGTNFSNSDLREVNFSYAFLRYTNFTNCKLDQINFDQSPYLSHKHEVTGFALSSDNKFLAATVGGDANIYIWDWANAQLIYTLKGGCLSDSATHRDTTDSIQFSPDNTLLAVSGAERFVSVWNLISKTQCEFEEMTHHSGELKFSPDGSLLAVGSAGVQLFDIKTKKKLHSCQQAHEQTTCLEFLQDGKYIISGSFDNKLRLWDAFSGKCIRVYTLHKDVVFKICINKSANLFASLSFEGTIGLWRRDTDQPIQIFHSPNQNEKYNRIKFCNTTDDLLVTSQSGQIKIFNQYSTQPKSSFETKAQIATLDIHPLDQIIALGGWKGDVVLWDIVKQSYLYSFNEHNDGVTKLCFSKNGESIISSSFDKTIRIHKSSVTRKNLVTSEEHSNGVFRLALCHITNILAASDYTGKIYLRNAQTGQHIYTLKGHSHLVASIAFSPDGMLLATANSGPKENLSTRIWDLRSFRCIKIFNNPNGQAIFNGTHFLNDNILIFVAGNNICLWDIVKNNLVATLSGHKKSISSCSLYRSSTSNNLLASCSFDMTIHVWDLDSYKILQVMTGHLDKLGNIDFSSDGKMLVSGSHDGDIRLWDIPAGHCTKVYRDHISMIHSLTFSPNNQYIASGDLVGIIRIAYIETGRITVIKKNLKQVLCLQFSQDNKLLACAGANKNVIIYDLQSQSIVATFASYHKPINNLIFLNANTLITCSEDRSIKCWQRSSSQNPSLWHLAWKSIEVNMLYVESIRLNDVLDLSAKNLMLLQQNGQNNYTESDNLNSAKTKSSIQNLQDTQKKREQALKFNSEGMQKYKQNKYEEAIELFKHALALTEEIYGTNHADVAALYQNIANSYNENKRTSPALEYYEKTVAIDEQIYFEANSTYAKHLVKLGLIHQKEGDNNHTWQPNKRYNSYHHYKAESKFKLALKMFSLLKEPTNIDIAEVEKNLQHCINCQKEGQKKNEGKPSI